LRNSNGYQRASLAKSSLVDTERSRPTYTVDAAKTNLSKLIERAEKGEEVVIARGKKPVARLVPMGVPAHLLRRRAFGVLKGRLKLPDSFFFDTLSEDELKFREGDDEVTANTSRRACRTASAPSAPFDRLRTGEQEGPLMRALLDTHALIWSVVGDARISPKLRQHLARPGQDVFVSAATAREIAAKASIGKLKAPGELLRDFVEAVEMLGFAPLPITLRHGTDAGQLPGAHLDPFDRMLAAQARAEGLDLVSCDPAFEMLGVKTLW
jgi:prevent-host-death family protein